MEDDFVLVVSQSYLLIMIRQNEGASVVEMPSKNNSSSWAPVRQGCLGSFRCPVPPPAAPFPSVLPCL